MLDTNVVLDWLVFRNPGCRPLTEAIERRQLRWIATPAMRNELAHVLSCGGLDAWAPDEAAIWTHWDRWATPAETPQLTGAALRMRCLDGDDQKFIDLALASAHWLISRDRAVLKLARRALVLGVRIAPPERWTPHT